jgi:hypothetical protein
MNHKRGELPTANMSRWSWKMIYDIRFLAKMYHMIITISYHIEHPHQIRRSNDDSWVKLVEYQPDRTIRWNFLSNKLHNGLFERKDPEHSESTLINTHFWLDWGNSSLSNQIQNTKLTPPIFHDASAPDICHPTEEAQSDPGSSVFCHKKQLPSERFSDKRPLSWIPQEILFDPHIARHLNLFPRCYSRPLRAVLQLAGWIQSVSVWWSNHCFWFRCYNQAIPIFALWASSVWKSSIDISLYPEAQRAVSTLMQCKSDLKCREETEKLKISFDELHWLCNGLLELIDSVKASRDEWIQICDDRTEAFCASSKSNTKWNSVHSRQKFGRFRALWTEFCELSDDSIEREIFRPKQSLWRSWKTEI